VIIVTDERICNRHPADGEFWGADFVDAIGEKSQYCSNLPVTKPPLPEAGGKSDGHFREKTLVASCLDIVVVDDERRDPCGSSYRNGLFNAAHVWGDRSGC
jgi:hypothetical protein